MTNFLKFTACILNTKFITRILIEPQKYVVYLDSSQFEGYTLLGSGSVRTENLRMDICEVESPKDYKTISNWIESDFSKN
jgi:hypothetical protein